MHGHPVVRRARAAEPVDYARDIQPILTKHCTSCHGAKKQRSSLRLDSVSAARRGGNSGPAVVPGKSGESHLFIAVSGGNDEIAAMPPKGPPLKERDIALLRTWIDSGAPIPASEKAEQTGNAASKHWAFQPIRRPAEPSVKNPHWCRNAIDRFILTRLEQQGIAPAPEADRVTLLRRLSLDLIGLPPSSKEIDDFLADKRPDAYERVVDRLLASPHYGERWGRHWLDLARYADSNGYSIDSPRSIWKYRDWVIDALQQRQAIRSNSSSNNWPAIFCPMRPSHSASPRVFIATRKKTKRAASIKNSSASSPSSIAPIRPGPSFLV